MNVLLTCAGRRNYLVEYFKVTLKTGSQIFAADCSSSAPALQEADKAFLVPRIDDPAYFDVILELCRKHEVGLLISLNDLELPSLARIKGDFSKAGIEVVISSPEVVDICFDKWRTFRFASGIGVAAAKTHTNLKSACEAIDSGELAFPLVVKPRWGSASIGIDIVSDLSELELAHKLSLLRLKRTILANVSSADHENSVLIQECLTGQEYGLDVVNDLSGNYVCTFVKKKLAMRAGETDRAEVVRDSAIERFGQLLGKSLSHVGNLDCDVFVNEKGIFLLEMNPRFGGGYPFSHVAGANVPAAIVSWAERKEADPSWLKVREGTIAAKCDRLVLKKHFL